MERQDQRQEIRLFPELRMVAISAAMQQVVGQIRKVAKIRYQPVLLTGETGVGKQEVALSLHHSDTFFHQHHQHDGGKKHGNAPFVDVDCVAIAPTLLESELFGHVKGAFTGADTDKRGRFEIAAGGTLFLDEVGDATGRAQLRLLKFLDTGMVTRVGSEEPKKIHTRVVAATHRNLAQLVARRRFREDLYFRLNVFPIHIPPLRERPDDIEPLVRRCIVSFNRAHKTNVSNLVSPELLASLAAYHWPGNIRELFNVIERAMVNKEGHGQISPSDIVFDQIPRIEAPASQTVKAEDSSEAGIVGMIGQDVSLKRIRSAVIKAHVEALLQRYGRVVKVSQVLETPRSNLYKIMEELGINWSVRARHSEQMDHTELDEDTQAERDLIARTLHEWKWDRATVAKRLNTTVEELARKIALFHITPQ